MAIFNGTSGPDTLSGTPSDDRMFGYAGDDKLFGNDGNDLLEGGTGADRLDGGLGDDRFYLDNVLDQIVEAAGGGTDILLSSVSYVLADGIFVEGLSTSDWTATDAINLTGNSLDNVISGNAGPNHLDGGEAGADVMQGFGGNDTYVVDNARDRVIEASGGGTDAVHAGVSYRLGAGVSVERLWADYEPATTAIDLTGNELANDIRGNFGANVLNGGAGADVMEGFGGNDRYYVDNALDRVLEASGGGNDLLLSSVSFALREFIFVEGLSTRDWSATSAIDLIGNSLDNGISGNAGANFLGGGGGNDSLVGFGGADTMLGGDGHDALFGGLGADSLTGGAGADKFRFDSALGGGNVDTITDFVAVDDTVVLDDTVFAGLPLGVLAANAFVTGGGATDADDRIVYNSATGALLFDADGNGAGAAVQFATLQTGLTLTAADFLVI